MNIVKRSFNYS